jgi:hypothetical protein
MSMADQRPRTQKTTPKKGEPVEIPVPKESTINRLLKKAAQPLATRRPST